jgi:pimeloyl-ACP methyl ester carboxylesterase
MAGNAELLSFVTADNETLHGALFRAEAPTRPDLALIMIHGVAMSFYTGPLPVFAQALAGRGHPAFSINTRGHDWISRGGDLTDFRGATYEDFEDCLLDLDAAIDRLKQEGFARFVLVGHSLGSVKSIYYQGTRQREDIVGVISCSAPRQFYSARLAEDPEFEARLADAERRVEEGQGEEYLWAPASGALGLFTYRTYVSKYGRHETNDVRPHAARLGCPLLVTAGEIEAAYFRELARELEESAGTDVCTCIIVDGANHFYDGCEGFMIDTLEGWLKENAS